MREFKQQVLPPGFKPTRVWSYGSADHPGTVEQGSSFNFLALTVEARAHEETGVKWINGVVDSNGRYLPHLLKSAADQTLHRANLL